MTPEHEERIERLERALLELVTWVPSGYYRGWRTSINECEFVNDIIGDLLDKYKPKDPSL